MDVAFILATMARRGLLRPGRPDRIVRQLDALRRWGLTVAGELRSAAARDPGRLAVVDEYRELTYGQLSDRVQRLAQAFRRGYGLGPNDRVGLLCHNHIGMIEALLATAAVGADVVLVNTGLGPSPLETVLHDQRIRVLVHDDEMYELVAAASPNAQRVSADGEPSRPSPTIAGLVAAAPSVDLPPPDRPGRTIVLTSGTTGAPRGAQRPVPPGFTPLAAVLSRIPLDMGERVYLAAPLFHTWGYAGLQLALALRATLVLRRRFEPLDALRAIADWRCTAMFAVPVMLQRLLDVPPRSRPADLPLRIVASSGAALPGDFAIRFMDAFGDVLYNLYGSTEASWASIATPEELRADPRCAGRPPHGTRLAILDDAGMPLPPGQVGRVFVGNDMLFDGYTSGGHDRESHQGLLATGDLGHLTSDGLLHVDGREDDMVVSGGENVYPSAVEHVLAQLPQVGEVAVAGVPDAQWGQRVSAWVVLRPGERLDADAVREYVRLHLDRFSVPRDVYFVARLPRNATGKVVARHLPADG